MRGVLLVASCVLASLVVVGHAASLKRQHVVLIAKAECNGAGEPQPNPDDCGSFLQCEASGVATVRPCPAGLEFNANLKVCDYPENAQCSTASDEDGSSSDSSSSQEGDDDSSSSSEEDDLLTANVNNKAKLFPSVKKPIAIPVHA